jgi:hypothetical protein
MEYTETYATEAEALAVIDILTAEQGCDASELYIRLVQS